MSRISLVLACAFAVVGLASNGAAHPPFKTPTKVKVTNGPGRPVPVYDVDAELGEPFHERTQINVSGFLHEPLFTVPAGQRAVIETVSASLTLSASSGLGALLSVETTLDANPADHFLVMVGQGVVLASEARTANHEVRLYADPGTQIFLNGAAPAGSSLFVTLSGYLVDVP